MFLWIQSYLKELFWSKFPILYLFRRIWTYPLSLRTSSRFSIRSTLNLSTPNRTWPFWRWKFCRMSLRRILDLQRLFSRQVKLDCLFLKHLPYFSRLAAPTLANDQKGQDPDRAAFIAQGVIFVLSTKNEFWIQICQNALYALNVLDYKLGPNVYELYLPMEEPVVRKFTNRFSLSSNF